jgi:CRISPR-associated endoribonuclease Cas6
MLRGAFGRALRKAVCLAGPEQPCGTCLLRHSCYHTVIFEPVFEGTVPPFLADLPIIPRAYIFEPGGDPGRWGREDERHLEAGDALELDLLLFGRATDLQLYALLACERMAVEGLGRNRAPFRLERALALAPDGTWRTVLADGRMRGRGSMRPSYPSEEPLPGPRAVLRFLTPTRLRIEDDGAETTTFPDLVTAMARRVFEVAAFHVPDAVIDWDLGPLLAAARAVELVRVDLRWHDWERYNVHQHTLMNMGGFMGTVEIAGDLAPFVPLLRATEILHLGRGTPFGLGRMEIGDPDDTVASKREREDRKRANVQDYVHLPLDPGLFL